MKFNEKSQVYRVLRPWLRDGLLVSKGKIACHAFPLSFNSFELLIKFQFYSSLFSGSKWQERRKILTPTFHFNILRQFCHVLEENSQRFVANLKKVAGRPIDVAPIISEFTLSSICGKFFVVLGKTTLLFCVNIN